jgi:misacylated tRNA(Ala) deacylase
VTDPLFIQDSYVQTAPGLVTALTELGGVVLDQSLFYATSGGQPGDRGQLIWDAGSLDVETTIKGEDGSIVLVPTGGQTLPTVGTAVTQVIDWEQRYAHMRMHTALHLLSVVIPLPVSGGAIGATKGRLDFDMPDAPDDKDVLTDQINALINADYAVTQSWITDAELEANPNLVKTMSVRPPMGAGRVRLVRIGDDTTQIDLQPCGGTHVKRTAEIGAVRIGKIEKKGKQNRRVSLLFVE